MANGTCPIEGCERPISVKGLCHKHYCYRRNESQTGTCSVEGCSRKVYTKGMCRACRAREVRNGTTAYKRQGAQPISEYNAAHNQVRATKGAASEYMCAGECGRRAIHWAYDHLDPHERFCAGSPYSMSVEHYMPLCGGCHKRMDVRLAESQAHRHIWFIGQQVAERVARQRSL